MNRKPETQNTVFYNVLQRIRKNRERQTNDAAVKRELQNLPDHLLADIGIDEESRKINNEVCMRNCMKRY